MTDNKLAGDKTRPCWQLEIAQPPKWSGAEAGLQHRQGSAEQRGWHLQGLVGLLLPAPRVKLW